MPCPDDAPCSEPSKSITRRNVAAGLGILISAAAVPSRAEAGCFFGRSCRPGSGGSGGGQCFLKGTRILTTRGEIEVEKLEPGDLVQTLDGPARGIKRIVSWDAKRKDGEDWIDDVAPIVIRRSALAQNIPHRDLYVSPRHSLYIDGMLFVANSLVNGRSIARCSKYDTETLSYFHVELDEHLVIYAEGAATESLLAEGMKPLAPTWFGGRRAELASRLRSAASPWIERRIPADMLRDQLEARALNWPRAA